MAMCDDHVWRLVGAHETLLANSWRNNNPQSNIAQVNLLKLADMDRDILLEVRR